MAFKKINRQIKVEEDRAEKSLRLDRRDYELKISPEILRTREHMVAFYQTLKMSDQNLAFLLYPEFEKLQKDIDNIERKLRRLYAERGDILS